MIFLTMTKFQIHFAHCSFTFLKFAHSLSEGKLKMNKFNVPSTREEIHEKKKSFLPLLSFVISFLSLTSSSITLSSSLPLFLSKPFLVDLSVPPLRRDSNVTLLPTSPFPAAAARNDNNNRGVDRAAMSAVPQSRTTRRWTSPARRCAPSASQDPRPSSTSSRSTLPLRVSGPVVWVVFPRCCRLFACLSMKSVAVMAIWSLRYWQSIGDPPFG